MSGPDGPQAPHGLGPDAQNAGGGRTRPRVCSPLGWHPPLRLCPVGTWLPVCLSVPRPAVLSGPAWVSLSGKSLTALDFVVPLPWRRYSRALGTRTHTCPWRPPSNPEHGAEPRQEVGTGLAEARWAEWAPVEVPWHLSAPGAQRAHHVGSVNERFSKGQRGVGSPDSGHLSLLKRRGAFLSERRNVVQAHGGMLSSFRRVTGMTSRTGAGHKGAGAEWSRSCEVPESSAPWRPGRAEGGVRERERVLAGTVWAARWGLGARAAGSVACASPR